MQQQGQINGVFGADTDHIEVITSSYGDLHSASGSQNLLTESPTNYHFTRSESGNGSRIGTPDQQTRVVRRLSKNFSKKGRKQSIFNDNLYKLPSRKICAIEGQFLTHNIAEIDQLATEIEQHDELMEDSVSGEQLRINTIRALPHSLTIKRQIKDKLSITMTQKTQKHPSGILKSLKYHTGMFLKHLWTYVANTIRSIEIWYESLKEIDGHFGSSVGAYFKFLRWLFLLNLMLVIFTLGFIIIPQLLYRTIEIEDSLTPNNSTSKYLKPLDLLTGEGYFTRSILFYGAFANMTLDLDSSNTYSIPHAYFMTMLLLYILTFVIISSSMARSYRKSFIETSGGVQSMFAHKIFCTWDFGISNMKAAHLKHVSIYNELKEVLNEMNDNKETVPKLIKFWNISSQITAHVLIAVMLAGLGVGMWTLLQNFGEENEESPWATLYLSIAVNITILVLQGFFSWIARMEDYSSPRRTLHVTLFRNFLLEAVIVSVLIIFWLTKSRTECWETSVGQEIYRLIIVDFFITVLFSSLFQLIQFTIKTKLWSSIGEPKFDISRKSLGLIFNQTLLWVGLFFSPLLPLVVVIKMIITFYIKKFTLIYLCKPPTQMWKSAQTQTLYLVFTFLSLLGVVIAYGYIMTQVPISKNCGPFKGHSYMFQIFVEGVLALRENHWIWRAIMTLARPAVVGGILVTMSVIVYYLRSKSRAEIAMVKLLKDMLYLEAKDKEFLLLNIARITQDKEYIFDDDELISSRRIRDNYAESSSTWKYESGENTQNVTELRSRRI